MVTAEFALGAAGMAAIEVVVDPIVHIRCFSVNTRHRK